MCLANPKKWFHLALLTTITSVLGGIAGYFIGFWLFQEIGAPALNALGKNEYLQEFQVMYDQFGALVVFAAGLSPFPYKVITIASGWLELNLLAFIIASIISRGLRFFLVAYLVATYGIAAKNWLKRNFALATTLFVATIIIVYLGLTWISG